MDRGTQGRTRLGLLAAASVAALACDADRDRGPAYVPPAGEGATETGLDDSHGDAGSEAGDEGGLGDCAEVEVQIETVPPTVVLLVDRSWSMTKDFAGAERWGAVYRTLMHPQTGIVPRLQSQIRFGLTLFTSNNGDQGGACPILTEVAPVIDGAMAIDEVLGAKRPIDEGPTGESLALTATTLAGQGGMGPKAIVLATDGEPDTCGQPNPDEGHAQALSAAVQAQELGIDVYVISVGDDVGDEHLQQMANAGVGRPIDAADPAPYYKALDVDALVSAFDEVVTALVRCDAVIEGVVDLDQACSGRVSLDGEALACGEDFVLTDETTLMLLGDACESLQRGGPHELHATWPCDAVAIP